VSFCANDAETELDAIKAVFGIGMVKSMLAIPELAPGAGAVTRRSRRSHAEVSAVLGDPVSRFTTMSSLLLRDDR
jgi:hypothetical protein